MHIKIFTFNPLQENTYVLYDETKEAVIIDAGCFLPEEEKALKKFIHEHDLKLKHLLNTHLHFDHQFGNRFAFDTYGIAPEAHKDDEFLNDNFARQTRAYGFENFGEAQPLKGYIADGETIKFGNTELIAIHVPGHSPGSLVYYCKKDGVLFSGDVLFLESIGRTDLPGGDYATLVTGIAKKLFCLPDNTVVYPGHGDSTTIGHEKTYNPYL